MITKTRTTKSIGITAASVVAAGLAVASLAPVPAQAATQPSSYTVSTGWKADWNGGCKAKATVTYYPNTNRAVMNTTVQSPYLFAACRVRTHLQVRTSNNVFEGVDQRVTACAVTDPTCASTIGTGNVTYGNAAPDFASYVDDLNEVLVAVGAPPIARQAVARGIYVSFSKA